MVVCNYNQNPDWWNSTVWFLQIR